jgi:peptidoglycan/xylan/chitin deacetylase (PgdA/CDA1 family)
MKTLILTYHSIFEDRPPLAISTSLFAEQMGWLASNAQVISLADLVQGLTAGSAVPERSVVLTFDDALLDFHTNAAPILHRLKLPAIIFVPTGRCGGTDQWNRTSASDERKLMSWEQIQELAQLGFDFGAHSVTHPILTKVSITQAEREIASSKGQLEGNLGKPIDFFCYPYGRWNHHIREIVRLHYRAACSAATGAAGTDADVFALPRIDTHYLRHRAFFRALFTPKLLRYLALRRVIRRARGYGEAS